MDFIKGITFYPFAPKGAFELKEVYDSLSVMKERTNANTVILVPVGLQETPQSISIDYSSNNTVSDCELKKMILYAKKLGLEVILKPTVNCKNGVWRAHINFFDEDVPCEPKWSQWFRAYTQFQMHYAKIAEEMGCNIFIAGCEMVMSERREKEWRKLIGDIRSVFKGLVSYNTDKYQEHNVKWWDCVDIISSSGYYPADQWECQLDRIEKVVNQFHKAFFFAEIGCMSTKGSSMIPNDWELLGDVALEEQAVWYETAFEAIEKRNWIKGVVLWSWDGSLYKRENVNEERYYEIYEKPAEQVVRSYFEKE